MQRQGIPPLGEFIPNTNQAELEIIGKTLLWDPLLRASAAALLDHGYFTPWRNRDDEAGCSKVRSAHSHIGVCTLIWIRHYWDQCLCRLNADVP
jgi:hypothetical protein